MLALDAVLVARSRDGERTIAVDDFLKSPFTTTLEPNEIATEVRIPKPAGSAGSTYLKLERKVGDFATIGAAVAIELDDGRISRAGVGLTAAGPRNVRAKAAEEALVGAEAGDEVFKEAARLAADAAEPRSDNRGSADYKRQVTREFVGRGLARSLELAQAD